MTIGTNTAEADIYSGYEVIESLFASDQTRVFRARRLTDGAAVILKTLADGNTTREALARMQHEYQVLARVDDAHVIRAIAFERRNSLPMLVLEDIQGRSLDRVLAEGPLSLEKTLQLGVKLAAGVAALHAAQIIHKDVNPSNIVFSERSGAVQLFDLGIASSFLVEHQEPTTVQGLPGTLEFMSPEQTGRMNRTLDYRTDLYSLGATLYRMLTGLPLFKVADPIEWFHCHVARQPRAPRELDPEIPQIVSDIIMKLLEKTAERRYQSAVGVGSDLTRCLEQLRQQGEIGDFELALQDAPTQFHMPQRLFGRNKDIQSLERAFEEARGGLSLALVTGPAGIGKSRLISELQRPVSRQRGYMCRGKFDQQQQQTPYSGLIMAQRDLIRQVLTESTQRVEAWKQQLLGTIGGNCRLLIDLIPELERVVGPQPEVPDMPPLESEQRLRLTLFGFFRVFAREEHPLVVVMDDLQWADAGTLQLFDLLVDVTREGHMLIVSAFRADEILPGHLLLEGLAKLKNSKLSITHISLQPLEIAEVKDLLSEAMRLPRPVVEPFARLVLNKTAGNPFFIEEFLLALYYRKLLRFDMSTLCWTADLNAIAAEDSTDNVIDLMLLKLGLLSAEARNLVKLAACSGNRFSLSTVAKLAGCDPATAARGLREAGALGLVIPVQDAYQLIELEQSVELPSVTVEFTFAHDRIQQTAYGLFDESERAQSHLALGRLLRAKSREGVPDQQLFAVVHHLNLASELITDAEERLDLCRMNFEAGKLATNTAAHQIAAGHFARTLDSLGTDAWRTDYQLARDLYAQLAQIAFLRGRYVEMDALVSTGLENARTLLDKTDFYEIQIAACIVRGELLEAIAIAKPVMAALGERYPAKPNRAHVILKLMQMKRRLGKDGVEKLRALPIMTNPEKLAALRIGGSLGSAAMFAQPLLLPLMVMQSLMMALDHGLAPEIGTSCSIAGMIMADTLDDAAGADALGLLGLEICSRFDDPRLQGRAQHLYSSLLEYRSNPLADTLVNLRRAAAICKQSGDFEYAVHATSIFTKYSFLSGADLINLEHELATNIDSFSELRQGPLVYHLRALHQLCLNFMGRAENPQILAGTAYNLERTLTHHRQSNDLTLIQTALSCQTWTSYNFDDSGGVAALAMVHRPEREIEGARGFYSYYWYQFVNAMVCLRASTSKHDSERRKLVAEAVNGRKMIERAAKRYPASFASKLFLIDAEHARVKGRDFKAHELFDKAVELSIDQSLLGDQALANELCGAMHLAAGRKTLGVPYLREACKLYRRWGAQGKVRYLERRYPLLAGGDVPTRDPLMPVQSLNITPLMKALKAIANEQIHSQMVAAVIKVAVEFAGAQRGVLALRNNRGEICIEAEADAETGNTRILQALPITQSSDIAQPIANYVIHTRTVVVIHDAGIKNADFAELRFDKHVIRNSSKSILCVPLLIGVDNAAELIGLLYLENNLATHSFTADRLDILEIICVAAAGRLELSRRATLDGLTDLFNHDYFQNMLKQEFASARRHERALSLILLDVDHFKAVNDTFGHQGGDLVLRELSNLLKECSREGDTVARYGGEEMALILPNTALEEALIVANRLRAVIESHVTLFEGKRIAVTASLGLAVLDADTEDGATLLRQADAALYRSKENGRNRVSVAGLADQPAGEGIREE